MKVDEHEQPAEHIHMLTFIFTSLVFFSATQGMFHLTREMISVLTYLQILL